MTRSTIFTLFVAITFALGIVPSSALACKCMLPTVAEAREQAVSVFEGRVTAIEDVPAKEGEGGGQKQVTLSLVRTWKGLENVETIVVSTSDSSASCGYMFEPNTSYLVYTNGSEAEPQVSGCSHTRAMSDAGEDLSVLGAGITPVEVKPAEATKPEPPKTAPKSGGCGSMRGSAQASSSLLLLPGLGAVLGARRRRTQRH